MKMSIPDTILWLGALVSFIVGTAPVPTYGWNPIGLGLTFAVLTIFVP